MNAKPDTSQEGRSESIFDSIRSQSILVSQEWKIYDQLFSKKDTHEFLYQVAHDAFRVIDESIYCMVQLRLCGLSDPAQGFKGDNNLSFKALFEEIKSSVAEPAKIEKLIKKFCKSCEPIRTVRNKIIAHKDVIQNRDKPFYVSRKRIRVCMKRLENIMDEVDRQKNVLFLDKDRPLRGDGEKLLEALKKSPDAAIFLSGSNLS